MKNVATAAAAGGLKLVVRLVDYEMENSCTCFSCDLTLLHCAREGG